jgi:hypothetical protein
MSPWKPVRLQRDGISKNGTRIFFLPSCSHFLIPVYTAFGDFPFQFVQPVIER